MLSSPPQFSNIASQSYLLSLGVVVDPLPHLAPEALPVVTEVVRCLNVEGVLEVCQVREQAV